MEYVLPGYSTLKQVAEFFNVGETAIKKNSTDNLERKAELERAGMGKFKINKGKTDFENGILVLENLRSQNSSDTNKSLKDPNKVFQKFEGVSKTKSIPGAIMLKHEEYNEFRFNNTGLLLFTAESIIKLGMFLTGTQSATIFRDNIIKSLKQGTIDKEEADTLSNIVEKFLQNVEDPSNLMDREDIFKAQVIIAKRKYRENTEKYFSFISEHLTKTIEDTRNEIDRLSNKMVLASPKEKVLLRRNITDLQFRHDELNETRDIFKAKQINQQLRFESSLKTEKCPTSKAIEEISNEENNLDATSANTVLIQMGILERKEQLRLTEKYEWISGVAGLFPKTKTRVTIQWNEFGRKFLKLVFSYYMRNQIEEFNKLTSDDIKAILYGVKEDDKVNELI